MEMVKYVIKRVIFILPVLIGVAIIIFTIMYFVPGDVTMSILGGSATDAEREYLREQLGLNRPYIVRLLEFLKQLFLRFDFGTSYTTGKAMLPDLLERLPRTVIIAIGSICIAVPLGLPLGITAAIHRNTALDRLSIFVSLLGVSMPNFWLAVLLIILFTLHLGILPSFGFDGLKSFIMPWIASCFGVMATLARQSRSSMLEVIRQDYITMAKAKGVVRRNIIWGHALPNALIPIVTVIGSSLAVGFAGSLIIEQIYSIPGLGLYMINAINIRDYAMVQGSVVFTSFMFSIIMLAVDLVYAFIDPRIKAQYVGVKRRKAENEQKA
jgi:peptide/nickel transport system permease protein